MSSTRARARRARGHGLRQGTAIGLTLAVAVAISLVATDRGQGGSASVSASSPCVGAPAPSGGFHHVVEVWFENTSATSNGTVSGAPFVNSLVTGCGHASRWTDANYKVDGTTKDGSYNSRPSYVTAATGVSPTVHGVTSDSYTSKTSKANMWAQAMSSGRSANAYMEGRASGDVCSGGGATSGAYHDSLRAVSPTLTNAWCNAHDLDLGQFDPAHLPAYSAVYPKNTSNWHDNSISSGDTWLKDHLSPLLNSPAYAAGDVAVVFHTDEDTPVVNAVIAPSVKPGAVIPAASHFSITRLIDDVMGQPELGDSPRAPSLLGLLGGGSPSTTSSSSSSSSTTSSSTSSSTSTSTSSTSTTTTTGPTGCADHTGQLVLTPTKYLNTLNPGDKLCWSGGIYWDTDDPGGHYGTAGGWEHFHHSGCFNLRIPATVKNTVCVGFGDGYRVEAGGGGFVFDTVMTHVGHDDCFENDQNLSGWIARPYCSGFVTYSSQGGSTNGNANTVVISDGWMQLFPIHNTYKGPDTPYDKYPADSTGGFFKTDGNAPSFVLTHNVFAAQVIPASYGTLGPPPRVRSCSRNIVMWFGKPGAFPASAKAAWLAACPDTEFVNA